MLGVVQEPKAPQYTSSRRMFWSAFAVAASLTIPAVEAIVSGGCAAVAPLIQSLSPPSGPYGTVVTIRGTGFTAENRVQFRGARFSFAADSPVSSQDGKTLEFRVSNCPSYEPKCPAFYIPPGTYAVAVVNASGTSNEASFEIEPP